MANGEGRGGGAGDVFSDKKQALQENARATEEANKSTSQYSETQEELTRSVTANVDALKHYKQAIEENESVLSGIVAKSKEWLKQQTSLRGALSGVTNELNALTILQKRYHARLEELGRSQKEFNASLFQSSKSIEQSRKRHDAYLKTIKQGHIDAIALANKYNLSMDETKKMTEELTGAFANQIQSYGDQSKALKGLQEQTLVFSKVMGVDTSRSIQFMRQQLEASGRTLDEVQNLTKAAAIAADSYAKWLDTLGDKSKRVARVTKEDLLDAIQKATDAYSKGKVEMEGFIAIQDNLIKGFEKAGINARDAKKIMGEFGTALANLQDDELQQYLSIDALEQAMQYAMQYGDETLKRRIQTAERIRTGRGEERSSPLAMRRMLGALKGSAAMQVAVMQSLNKMPEQLRTEFLKQAGVEGQFSVDVLLEQLAPGSEAMKEMKEAMQTQADKDAAAKGEQKSAWDQMIATTKAGHETQQSEYQVAVEIRNQMQNLHSLLHLTQYGIMTAIGAAAIGGIARAVGGKLVRRAAGRAITRRAVTSTARRTATSGVVRGAGRSALLRTGAKTVGGTALAAGGAYGVSEAIPGAVSAAGSTAEKRAVAGTVSLTGEQFAKVAGKETAEKGIMKRLSKKVMQSGAVKLAGRGASRAIPIIGTALAAYDAYQLIEHAGGAIAASLDKEAGAIMRRSKDTTLSGWFGAQAAKTSEDAGTMFADTVMSMVSPLSVRGERKKIGGAYRADAPKWIDKISNEEMNVRLRTLETRKEQLTALKKRQEQIKKFTLEEDEVLNEKINTIEKGIKQDEKIIDLKRQVIDVDEKASKSSAIMEGRKGLTGLMKKVRESGGKLTPEKLAKLSQEFFGDTGRLMARKGFGQDVLKELLTGRFGKGEELRALAAEHGMDYETFQKVMGQQLTQAQLGQQGYLRRGIMAVGYTPEERRASMKKGRLSKEEARKLSTKEVAAKWLQLKKAGVVGQKTLHSPWINVATEDIKAASKGAGISLTPEVSFADTGSADLPQEVQSDPATGVLSFKVPFFEQTVTLRSAGLSKAVTADQYNMSDKHR